MLPLAGNRHMHVNEREKPAASGMEFPTWCGFTRLYEQDAMCT